MTCFFCKIAQGDMPAKTVYQDDKVMAFNDINPQAPAHLLIIPKKHISTLNDLTMDDEALVGKLFITAKTLAAELGFADSGYRTVFNCNAHGGQSVYHIHLHLLAGRQMSWPPG
jgi:histidine triad (HIT) family protein